MSDISISIYLVTFLFFVVAFVYSSVGLGGGSSYTALMVVLSFNMLSIPMISLILNLLATSFGVYHFVKRGYLRLNLILPFLITSMPMAWIGGSLHLPKLLFQWILAFSLLGVVARIYLWRDTSFSLSLNNRQTIIISMFIGALLGMLAGIVGIGGGIYLVPLILILGLGDIKEAATCGAIFIWLNSIVGLVSRLQYNYIDLTPFLSLIIVVILGGFLGSFVGAFKLPLQHMEKILGSVAAVALLLLGNKLVFL